MISENLSVLTIFVGERVIYNLIGTELDRGEQ